MIATDAQFPGSGAAAGLLLSRQGPLAAPRGLVLSRQPPAPAFRARLSLFQRTSSTPSRSVFATCLDMVRYNQECLQVLHKNPEGETDRKKP